MAVNPLALRSAVFAIISGAVYFLLGDGKKAMERAEETPAPAPKKEPKNEPKEPAASAPEGAPEAPKDGT